MSKSAISSSQSLVVVDGSRGEGGGQILRNALSFACLLRQPIEINNIRAGRRQPGLKPQHLTGLRLSASIAGGRLEGDELGSTVIRYRPPPAPVVTGADSTSNAESTEELQTFVADTGTAGSICLLLQVSLPLTVLSSSHRCHLDLRGGTNADSAPQIDYFTRVFLPTACQHLGLSPVDVQIERRGYYPRGGGIVHVHSKPMTTPLTPITLTERGDVCDVSIRAFHAGKVPSRAAASIANAALAVLAESTDVIPAEVQPTIEVVTERNAVGSGSGILIVAKTSTGCWLAGSALGRPKKRDVEVGREAAMELVNTLRDGGCVDEWLQDQLVLWMALADGVSEVVTGSWTLHSMTAVMVAEEMSGAKFEVVRLDVDEEKTGDGGKEVSDKYGKDGRVSGRHLVRCRGVGFVPRSMGE